MVVKRNDTRDIDVWELKLIRVTHALWALYRGKSEPLSERGHIMEAIETMIGIKREYRRELALKREALNAKVRERFKAVRA